MRWPRKWLDRLRHTRAGTRLLGDRGERAAARYLKKQGLRITARQYTSRLGEIDLIARDGRTIVFVEVKSRRSHAAGRPEEAVNVTKQRQLTRLGLEYLKRHGLLGKQRARFDVVSVTWPENKTRPEIVHYRNAFEPTGVDGMFS